MATPNTAEKNERLSDFAADFATATLQIRQGSTVLASYTLAGWDTPSAGSVSANAIAQVTNSATGLADNAKLIAGALEYDLSVGTSGADLNINDLNFIKDVTSSVSGLTITV